MSDPITVTGANLWDIRMKLGIRNDEYGISLSGDPFQPQYYVRTPNASQRFISPQQALHFLRSELLTDIRKKKNSFTKLKKDKRLKKSYSRSRRAR